jgi:hypothetical protein
MTRWQKERLQKQLEFFGAKKQKFISSYAKKPRIRMPSTKAADDMLLSIGRKQAIARQAVTNARSMALYQQQTQLGIQNSINGIYQMQQLSGLMGMPNSANVVRAMQNPFIPYTQGWCG